MIDEYIRLAAIRDYWIPRDLLAKAEVRVTDIDGVLREIERLRAELESERMPEEQIMTNVEEVSRGSR